MLKKKQIDVGSCGFAENDLNGSGFNGNPKVSLDENIGIDLISSSISSVILTDFIEEIDDIGEVRRNEDDGIEDELDDLEEDLDDSPNEDDKEESEEGGVVDKKGSSVSESILYKIPYVSDPLIGSPKSVQKELDDLVIKIQINTLNIQRNSGTGREQSLQDENDELYNKIHLYMHGYLINVALKQFPYIKGLQTSDIYQESLIALRFKAIPNFNNGKGMSFLNFSKMCIRRHLITILNASNNRKRDWSINQAVSIDEPIIDDDDSSTLFNTLKDGSIGFDKASESKEAFDVTKDVLMDFLSDFEKDVLNEYLSNSSYQEIARTISNKTKKKCDAKAVDNALLRIRKKAMLVRGSRSVEDLPIFI